MNPTTHPKLFRRLDRTDTLRPGDTYCAAGSWNITTHAGERPDELTGGMIYYRPRYLPLAHGEQILAGSVFFSTDGTMYNSALNARDNQQQGCNAVQYYKLNPHFNPTTQTPMKNNNVIINTNGVPALRAAVIAAMATNPAFTATKNWSLVRNPSAGAYIYYGFDGGDTVDNTYHNDRISPSWSTATLFNAATQFGAIVDWAASVNAKPTTVTIKLPNYEAVVTPGVGVQIGCQNATKAEVDKLLGTLSEGHNINMTTEGRSRTGRNPITLVDATFEIRGERITLAQLQEIGKALNS